MEDKNDISIRFALEHDAEAMMTLIKELALYENAPEEVTVSMDHFVESGFGPNPVWWSLVAVRSSAQTQIEEIVGFALYYIRYSTWKGQRMYLEDILVKEEWRGKGIGGLLMDKLITIAREKKYTGLHWQVLAWNKPAIQFYEKYLTRFDAEWINVSLEL